MTDGLLWLIPLLPLAAAIINGLVGQRRGRAFTTLLAVGSVWLSFLVVLFFVVTYGMGDHSKPLEVQAPFYWFDAGAFRLRMGLLLDPLSLVMISIVTGVGGLIHTYSIGYMADDPGYNRYFCYLNLFTFSMLMLVLGNSFLVLFVGWELVGLCSYLLIGFWYDRQSATDAGKKAFIVNRVGDWAFVIGIILTFVAFMPQVGTSDGLRFTPVFQYFAETWHANQGIPQSLWLVPTIATLLFIGATGKSAQLPLLYIWLPDAMEGPTPVSALIHAATMVTAGVYMVARCHLFYLASPEVMHSIAWVGAATAFYAATVAMVQTDIKRVLAYSTVSQIGFMFIGAGVGAFSYSIFHLLTHAFFKALLFLGAGAVIHALHNEQDMRKMGGLRDRLRPIALLMLAGVLAIAGFPFTSGFFSKDMILGRAAEYSIWLWLLGTIAAFMTAFYMTRLWLMTFWGEEHWQEALRHSVADTGHEPEGGHEPGHGTDLHPTPANMMIPMAVLAVLSLFGGVFALFLPGFLEPVFRDGAAAAHEGHAFASELVLYGIAALVVLGGAAAAWAAYGRSNLEPKPWMKQSPGAYHLLTNAWYVDKAMHLLFARGGEDASRAIYNDVEMRAIDGVGVNGVGSGVRWFSRHLRHSQSGVVGDYALAMAFGAASVVVYFLLR